MQDDITQVRMHQLQSSLSGTMLCETYAACKEESMCVGRYHAYAHALATEYPQRYCVVRPTQPVRRNLDVQEDTAHALATEFSQRYCIV